MLYQTNHAPYYAKKKASYNFTLHAHHAIELLVCTSGSCMASCNFRTEVLRPGDVMIAFPNDIHAYTATKVPDSYGITIIADPGLLSMLAPRLEQNRYANFLLSGNPTLIRYAEGFLGEYQAEQNEEILLGYLYLLLGTIFKELPCAENKLGLESTQFSAVLQYVSCHYTEKLSLRSLSKQFGISVSHLSRTFTQKLSCNFLNYLHILRVEHAKNLLRHSAMPILQVGLESGFSDQRTFNRVFLEHAGIPPKVYRQQHRC